MPEAQRLSSGLLSQKGGNIGEHRSRIKGESRQNLLTILNGKEPGRLNFYQALLIL